MKECSGTADLTKAAGWIEIMRPVCREARLSRVLARSRRGRGGLWAENRLGFAIGTKASAGVFTSFWADA